MEYDPVVEGVKLLPEITVPENTPPAPDGVPVSTTLLLPWQYEEASPLKLTVGAVFTVVF